MDLPSIFAGAWGTPGSTDVARTVVSQAQSSWGIPGDALKLLFPTSVPSATPTVTTPSLDPGRETTSAVANTNKQDAQAPAGFWAQNGRLLLIGGAILAVVVFFFFRRR